MKNTNFLMSLILVISWAQVSFAQKKTTTRPKAKINVEKDVDTLGGNEDLMKMAQSLRSQTRTRIVQDRIVDRRNRLELGLSYGGTVGGDSYLQSQALGGSALFHFTPRFAVGAQYTDFTSSLTPEGKRVFNQYREQQKAGGAPAYAVDIDYPKDSMMGLIHWYPIYGKTSFLDVGVTQFDLYLIGGAGQINLSSGSTGIYAGGIGIGAWLSQHFSLRAEAKYQTYEDRPVTGKRTLNTGMMNLGMGWIL